MNHLITRRTATITGIVVIIQTVMLVITVGFALNQSAMVDKERSMAAESRVEAMHQRNIAGQPRIHQQMTQLQH